MASHREERYEERQKQAKPLLEAFFEWLHSLEDSVDRSSLIGRAVLYALNQEGLSETLSGRRAFKYR